MRRLWPVALVVAVAVGVFVAIRATSDDSSDDRLRQLAAADNFANSTDATGALVTVAKQMIDEGAACTEEFGPADPRCETRGLIAAWAQISALEVPGCTRPTLAQARADLLALLDALRAIEAEETTDVPAVPAVPSC